MKDKTQTIPTEESDMSLHSNPNNKAPGIDDIPIKLIKVEETTNKDTFLFV